MISLSNFKLFQVFQLAKNSDHLDNVFACASQHFQCGRLDEAEEIYRQVLHDHANHPRALHALGVIAHRKGKGKAAVALIHQAIAVKPDFPDAYNNLGNVCKEQGCLDEAMAAYQRAISQKPDFAMAHCNLGNVFKDQGKLDEAIACFRKAIDLKADYPDAYNELGIALIELGHVEEAIKYFKKSLAISYDCAVLNNLGNAIMDKGKLHRAIECFEEAIILNSDYANSYNNLGVALARRGNPEEAALNYRKAIELNPDDALAYSNLGDAFRDMAMLDEAVACYTRSVSIRPDNHKAYNNLAVVLAEQGKLTKAFECYKKSLAAKPDAPAHSNLIFSMNYMPAVTAEEIYLESRRWDLVHGVSFAGRSVIPQKNHRLNQRLRIGYVSPDFKVHSVSYFFEPLIANHDRAIVEVFCYSDVLNPDKTTKRLKRFADGWVKSAGLSNEALAERIKKDSIDILVDLAGHTAKNRLLVFTEKPAPVQVTWLGYPNTTGLSAMDYRLTDAIVDPVGIADELHTEKLFRLPDSFLCYRPPSRFPRVFPLPAKRNNFITFGSFNNLTKITPEVVSVWSGILGLLPTSRLILKNRALGDSLTRNCYMQMFQDCGITPDRITLMSFKPSTEGHLALYNSVDIGLDTFPYNGTTTTCEALWMGVPVITLHGNRHASRVGASLLRNVGLQCLVAETTEEYLHTALNLAQDRRRLADLRRTLRKQMATSPLCNAAGFARNIENAFQYIWDAHCRKNNDSSAKGGKEA